MIKSKPSFFNGYGTHQDCEAPELWKDITLALNPTLGKQGTKLVDFSGLRNHGAINGAIWTPHPRGLGLEFFGGTERVELANPSNFHFASAGQDLPFSASFTIFMHDNAGFNILTKGSLTNREFRIATRGGGNSGKLRFQLSGTAIGSISIGADALSVVLATNTLYRIDVTYDGSETFAGMKIYVNGLPITTTDVSAGVYTGVRDSGDQVWIGGWDGSFTADGLIFDVKIWNYERSPGQIKQHHRDSDAMFRHPLPPRYFIIPSIGVTELISIKSFKTPGRTTSFKTSGRTTSFKIPGRTTSFKTPGI